MQRDSVYNPASTKIPDGWKEGLERKSVLDKPRTAIVTKINNPVYCDRGYEISQEECDNLLHRKVNLVLFDNPTRYYQTSDYLWIYEECLDFDLENREDSQFHIPIYGNEDEMINPSQKSSEVFIHILQGIRLLSASYCIFLRGVSSVFNYNDHHRFDLSKLITLKYGKGMNYFIVQSSGDLGDGISVPNDVHSYVMSVIQSNMSVGLIKPEYIVGIFVQWCRRFDLASGAINDVEVKFCRLQELYKSINAEDIYFDTVDDMLVKAFSYILDVPDHTINDEEKRIECLKKILNNGLAKLENEFMSYYSSVE